MRSSCCAGRAGCLHVVRRLVRVEYARHLPLFRRQHAEGRLVLRVDRLQDAAHLLVCLLLVELQEMLDLFTCLLPGFQLRQRSVRGGRRCGRGSGRRGRVPVPARQLLQQHPFFGRREGPPQSLLRELPQQRVECVVAHGLPPFKVRPRRRCVRSGGRRQWISHGVLPEMDVRRPRRKVRQDRCRDESGDGSVKSGATCE